MKVEDLMLGDWVQVEGIPLRVGGLSNYDIYVDLFRGNESEVYSQIWADEMDSIQPIPITPEILEKNGWEHKWWWVHPSTSICFQEKITGDFRVMPDTECDKRDWFTTIKYVHELQHLYKLCGIEKEIVL